MKKFFLIIALTLVPYLMFSQSMYSPTWGFQIHLPEGYEFAEGDGRDRFSFAGPAGAMFDIVVYQGIYANISELAADVNRRLGNRGAVDYFLYNNRQAAIIELIFGEFTGWALCLEINIPHGAPNSPRPMLLALAYGPAQNAEFLNIFHMSALDSIIPCVNEKFSVGPIMAYAFPRENQKTVSLGTSGLTALIYENDAQAAQVLIEREFSILINYINTPMWQDAWIRYYRMIYRDSRARIGQAAAALAQNWGGHRARTVEAQRTFAQRALAFVQGFYYERNFTGSDFINLVTAITEERGDCDSRAMLWAIILASADIRSAMMISPQHSHAMGLADIGGTGARFEALGTHWLVAETTKNVDIGLIAQDFSDPAHWFAVIFE